MQNPPHVHECHYLYPDGRRCRRIPKRGERLCRDHKRARRSTHTEDAAFTRQIEAYADRLMSLPLDVLAAEAAFALSAMSPILESRYRRTHRLLFSRAELAIAAFVDSLESRQTPPTPPAGISSRSAYPHALQNQMHPAHPEGPPRAGQTAELPTK
ncbi:MAG TPA: hypothetical protein VJV22_07905 [Acidobacteriaceae bacterium]|nr:hypothetical protein [Acidobacteriaceae bacterium]